MAVEDAITQLLLAHRQGNREASDKLFALVYDELHGMAHRQMRRGGGSVGFAENNTAAPCFRARSRCASPVVRAA